MIQFSVFCLKWLLGLPNLWRRLWRFKQPGSQATCYRCFAINCNFYITLLSWITLIRHPPTLKTYRVRSVCPGCLFAGRWLPYNRTLRQSVLSPKCPSFFNEVLLNRSCHAYLKGTIISLRHGRPPPTCNTKTRCINSSRKPVRDLTMCLTP